MAPLAACSAVILAAAPAQYLGRQQDDLLYIIGARSLLEGRFRLLTVPGEPPLYMINPGFPALLTPVAWLAGERWGIYQATCALLLAAAPWTLWFWLRKRTAAPQALLVCALLATSPLVLSQAGTVMSETPYLLAAFGLLFALDSPIRSKAAAAWLFALVFLRTAAVSLAPAALARSLAQKRWREALEIAAPAAAGLLIWSAWSRLTAGVAQQKIEELAVSYTGRVSRLPQVALENAGYYLSSWGASFLPPRGAAGPAATILGLALLAVAARGALHRLRRDRWEPAVWMLAGTILLHLVWPWHYERYLIMPLPLLLWFLGEGLGPAALPVLALLLAGQTAFYLPAWLRHEHNWTRPELSETYDWVRARTAPEAIVASQMYVRDGFYCARPALALPPGRNPGAFYDALKSHKVRYVLWQDGLDLGLSQSTDAAVTRLLEQDRRNLDDASRFRAVYENAPEHARLYELR